MSESVISFGRRFGKSYAAAEAMRAARLSGQRCAFVTGNAKWGVRMLREHGVTGVLVIETRNRVSTITNATKSQPAS